VDPNPEILNPGAQARLRLRLSPRIAEDKSQTVTTHLLGQAKITGLPFVETDGSPVTVDTDYSGKRRDSGNPMAGPLEQPGKGVVTAPAP
jgi:hypothetical protein